VNTVDDETRATLLAEWLRAPVGTPPPEGLDPEVVAAVVALRPERAPAPRVRVEDILGDVKEGPFAMPPSTATEPVRFPTVPANRTRRGWWALPGIGVAMAAAAAVMVVVFVGGPSQQELQEAVRAGSSAAEAPPAPPAAVSPSPLGAAQTGVPEMDAPAAEALEERRADAAAAPGAGAAPMGGSTVPDVAAAREVLDQPAPPAEVDGVFGAEEGAANTASGLVPELSSRAYEGSGNTAGYAPMDAGDEKKADLDWADADDAAGPPASPEAEAASTSATRGAGGRSRAEAGEADEELQKAREPAKPRASAPAASTPAAPAPVAVPGTSVHAKTSTTATDDQTQTASLDYNSSWYSVYPDVSTIYRAAAAQEAAGNWSGAVDLYRPLWSDGRVDVAQDSAWRGARALQAQGRISEALAVTEAGLRRSKAATVFRAQLLVLKGDILAAIGDRVNADKAWMEAADVNEQR